MTKPTNGTTACAGPVGGVRPRALLGLGLAALATIACAQRDRAATADSTRSDTTLAGAPPASPTPARDTIPPTAATTSATAGGAAAKDSAPAAPASGGERQRTRAASTPGEAKRLDAATRNAARHGATTRDTAATGKVTPPPALRKTSATPAESTTRKTAASGAATGAAGQGRDTAGAATGAAAASSSGAAGAGAAAQPPAQQAAGAASQGNDHLTASPAAYQGWKTFHVYCYRCHGVDAMGSDLAPNLRHSVGPEGSVTHDVFVTTVKEGRVAKGMPSWKTLLDDQQIENVYAYVKARSSGELAPGRPRQAKAP
jgi:mono/diheme cytochrome c family protein